MEITHPFVFQVDSEIVMEHYNNQLNYLIEYNKNVPKEYCVVYFSSNDLYYPNNEIAFSESILKKNRFEWYGNRIAIGHKHIFLRDIRKQWYLTGINSQINSFGKLIDFLKEETKGYKVITLGSSAGGFASIITGQGINAEKICSFNGQFEILSLLKKSKPEVDPILFRNQKNSEMLPYYDTLNFITSPSSIFYFQSCKSQWDIEQAEYATSVKLNKIAFRTTNHGVPFLKSNLPHVINLNREQLLKLAGKTFHPLFFSLKTVGVIETVKGVSSIIQFGLNKIYIRTIQKWKSK
ncbi:hypothetical protein HNQ91_000023 [Filimonas zeae]|uniref:Uncharacterized protein n=1 Tax=Filimonas zeae TaxID=1737353 RepID=A0A917IKT9_9BACT|nr:hypothetical protein [Filimonas zeae]MDR6337001.1 hypothetical protein [Filimonas zeae]GGH56530.1 hypothetical protein GCM10011379_00220 [Filimonas zeae]